MEDIATEQKRMEQPMQQRNMQKDAILNRLRQRGCRITKQRMVLLDIILDGDNSSIVLTQKAWNQIIQAGLSVCGYKDKQAIRSINPA